VAVKKASVAKKKKVVKSASKKKRPAKKSVGKKAKVTKPSGKSSGRKLIKKKLVERVEKDEDRMSFDESADEDVESLTAEEIDKELQDYELLKEKTISKGKKAVVTGGTSDLALRIGRLVFEKKGEDVVLADLNGLTSVTDYFVIATATSDLHARAISDHIVDSLEAAGIRPHHKEGYSSFKWVLIDYVDVVVHVFQRDAREYYDLERLWGDAKFKKLRDE